MENLFSISAIEVLNETLSTSVLKIEPSPPKHNSTSIVDPATEITVYSLTIEHAVPISIFVSSYYVDYALTPTNTLCFDSFR